MSEPKFCIDCIWSQQDPNSNWQLRCHNKEVNKKDPHALGSAKINGVSCTEARKPGWFQVCGIKGKLYNTGAYP